MQSKKDAYTWNRLGEFTRKSMIGAWLFRYVYYGYLVNEYHQSWISWNQVFFLFGIVLMITTMHRIYRPTSSDLITSDVFALTRHPMYHGMFLADAALFFVADLSSIPFWFSWVLFVVLICRAGWFQEKETLACWGTEAALYYAKTPRFIFEWLWYPFWKIRAA